MSWTLEGIEQTIYLWQSLHITIATNRASVWRLIIFTKIFEMPSIITRVL